MAHAWMPEARRIRADTDGGPLIGGAPRAVWLTLGTAPGAVSVQSAAQRLIGERRPCHLIWDPVTGDVAQLISVLRAGRALGAADHLDWAPGRVKAHPENVNAEGRVCVQIGVLGHPGPAVHRRHAHRDRGDRELARLLGRVAPLAGRAAGGVPDRACRPRRRSSTGAAGWTWARGGHFGASQVPGCDNAGPGRHRRRPDHRPPRPPGPRPRPARPARRGGPPHPGVGAAVARRCH